MQVEAYKKEDMFISNINKDQTFLKNSKLRVYGCNAYNCLEFLYADSTEQKVLGECIAAFNGCIKLVQVPAATSNSVDSQASKDEVDDALKQLKPKQQALILSCFEYLAFLYLISKEPLKALAVIARGQKIATG